MSNKFEAMSGNQFNLVETPTLPLPPPRASTEAVERLLKALSADEIASLTNRLEASRLRQSTLPKSKKSTTTAVQQPSWQLPITRAIVSKNNKKLQALSPSAPGVEVFRPDLSDKTPVEIIKHLSSELKANPTVQKSQFLQHVINGYTSVNDVDHDLKKEIEKASIISQGIQTLDDIWYIAYVDANYGGSSVMYRLSSGWIYYAVSWVGSDIIRTHGTKKRAATSGQ
jgi:hypothetical protein